MLIRTLEILGPSLSTDITEYFVKVLGLKPAAARQRVARSHPGIKKLKHLPFARGARFVYLEKDYLSPRYWEALKKAIYESKGAYARALGAVTAREIVPIDHFRIACGAPIAQKKHIAADTVLDRMVDASVLARVEVPGVGECVTTRRFAEGWAMEGEAAGLQARLLTEQILLDSIKEWLKNLGIASYHKVVCRDGAADLAKVGTFAWDLTAPTYLSALATFSKAGPKPGFVVCDVLMNKVVGVEGINPFLYKCISLKSLKRVGNTLFIFVADRYSSEAFAAAKSAGIIPATPESLFGKDVAEGFRQLSSVLKNAASGAIDPVQFDSLFKKLSSVEGAIGNMRGAFFELLVAEVVRRKSAAGTVLVNKLCKGLDGSKAEVDVWVVNPNIEARFIECKGRQPGSLIDDAEIDDWLDKRILRVRQYIKSVFDWTPKMPVFELWVTGILSPHAEERIEKTRLANIGKFQLITRRSDDIRRLTEEVNDASLLKTFEQHFLAPSRG